MPRRRGRRRSTPLQSPTCRCVVHASACSPHPLVHSPLPFTRRQRQAQLRAATADASTAKAAALRAPAPPHAAAAAAPGADAVAALERRLLETREELRASQRAERAAVAEAQRLAASVQVRRLQAGGICSYGMGREGEEEEGGTAADSRRGVCSYVGPFLLDVWRSGWALQTTPLPSPCPTAQNSELKSQQLASLEARCARLSAAAQHSGSLRVRWRGGCPARADRQWPPVSPPHRRPAWCPWRPSCPSGTLPRAAGGRGAAPAAASQRRGWQRPSPQRCRQQAMRGRQECLGPPRLPLRTPWRGH